IADIRTIENLSAEQPLGVEIYARRDADPNAAGLKVFSRERPIPLSERVPVLENMAFKVGDDGTYRTDPAGADQVLLQYMLLVRVRGATELEAVKQRLEACFRAVMHANAESDVINALVLVAGVP